MIAIALRVVGKVAMFLGAVVIGDLEQKAEQRIEATATADNELPDFAYASVIANGCSGTIVSCGEKWACGVTAAHCFRGYVGGKFTVRYLDGSTSEATLLAVDRSRDLARFSVPAESVLDVAPVSAGWPDKARYEAIGFPGTDRGKPRYYRIRPTQQPLVRINGEQFQASYYTSQGGPNYNRSYSPSGGIESAPWRYEFSADGGHVYPGASGCGVFANGRLIGVLSNNNGHNVGTVLRCCTLDQLQSFLKESDANGCAAWNMGEWSAPPVMLADAPKALPYTSTKVEYRCDQNGCYRVAQAPQAFGVPPPPPDANAAPPQPDGYIAPPPPDEPPPQAQPKKRLKLLDRLRQNKAARQKDKLPKDVKGNCNQAERILELQSEIKRLEDEIAHKPGTPGQPGHDGKDGRDGRDGKDFTPPPAVEKPKPKHKFPIALALFGGVLAVGLFGRFRAAKTA